MVSVARIIAVLIVLLPIATSAFAQAFPNKSIRFVVPYAPGGSTACRPKVACARMPPAGITSFSRNA